MNLSPRPKSRPPGRRLFNVQESDGDFALFRSPSAGEKGPGDGAFSGLCLVPEVYDFPRIHATVT